jgi:pimeloyl-ACP methyl ester carboxylesterase
MESAWTTFNGVGVHTLVSIPNSKTKTHTVDTPRILLHGTGSSSMVFESMMNRDRNRYSFAIDLPGYGISGDLESVPEVPHDYYADVIEATRIEMCKRYGLDVFQPFEFVGHSFGAYVLIHYLSIEHSFVVSKATLVCPAGLYPVLGKWGYYWARFFAWGGPSLITTSWLWWLLTPLLWFYIDPVYLWYSSVPGMGSQVLSKYITFPSMMEAYWNHPVCKLLLELSETVPIQLVFGENDTIIPPHQGHFFRRRGIKVTEILGGGHGFCDWDQPPRSTPSLSETERTIQRFYDDLEKDTHNLNKRN